MTKYMFLLNCNISLIVSYKTNSVTTQTVLFSFFTRRCS